MVANYRYLLLPPVRPTIPCEAVMDLNGLSLSLSLSLSHFPMPIAPFNTWEPLTFRKGASIYDVRTEGGRGEGVSLKEDVVREVA